MAERLMAVTFDLGGTLVENENVTWRRSVALAFPACRYILPPADESTCRLPNRREC
jgi:hypothetical protein